MSDETPCEQGNDREGIQMIRYIILQSEPYEGLCCVDAWGDEAQDRAKDLGLISPKGRRNTAEILAVRV